MSPPPASSLIRVKLPPTTTSSSTRPTVSSSESPHPSSSSSSPKKEDNHSYKPTSIPYTPRKNNTIPTTETSTSFRKNEQARTPSRRHNRRFRNGGNNALPLPPQLLGNEISPTPFRRTPSSKGRDLTLTLSSTISVTSKKHGNLSEVTKQQKKKDIKLPSPTSSSSASSGNVNFKFKEGKFTPNNKKQFQPIKPLSFKKDLSTSVKKKKDSNDPLRYQDPLLFSVSSSRSTSTGVHSITSSACLSSSSSEHAINSKTVLDDPFIIQKNVNDRINLESVLSDDPLITEKKASPKEEEKEVLVNYDGNDDSFLENWVTIKGFDDSGCDIEWEGSSYSGRARTTSMESSIFTTCSSSDTSEDCTEIDTSSPSNDVFKDSFCTPSSSSSSSSKKKMQNSEHQSMGISPSSSSFDSRNSFDHVTSPSLAFERELLLNEGFPSFNGILGTFQIHGATERQFAYHEEGGKACLCEESYLINSDNEKGMNTLHLGVLEEKEYEDRDGQEEEEEDFPLSMLEKSLRGLVDETCYHDGDHRYSFYDDDDDEDLLFPSSPTLRFSSTSSFHTYPSFNQERHSEGRRTTSPLDVYAAARDQRFIGASPFPLPPPVIRNALNTFENTLETYSKNIFPSSSTTPASTSSYSTSSNGSATSPNCQFGNDKTIISTPSMMNRDGGSESKGSICRCGCGEEDLSFSTSSSSNYSDQSLFPTSASYAYAPHASASKGIFNSSLHKSIWSISSPPTSPTKNKNSYSRPTTFNLVGNGNSKNVSSIFEGDELFDVSYAGTSTYIPSEDYCFPQPASSALPESPFGPTRPTLKRATSSYLANNEVYSAHLPYYYHESPHAGSPYHHNHSYSEGGGKPGNMARHAPPHPPHPPHHNRFHSQQQQLHHVSYGPSPNNKKGELYKTELCRSWSEIGSCRYAEKCQFAHGLEELRPMPSHYHSHLPPHHHHHHQAALPHYHPNRQNEDQFYLHHQRERENMARSSPLHARVHCYPASSPFERQNQSSTPAFINDSPASSSSIYKLHNFQEDLINGRRRSISSPSKVRMYSIDRAHPEEEIREVEFGSIGWKDNQSGLDKIHFSPFNMPETPRRSRMQRNFTLPLQVDKGSKSSLYAALQAEAADAPAPSNFAACA